MADGVAEAAGVWALSRSTMERISHAVGVGGLGLEQVARMEALHAQTARELRAAALRAPESRERSDLVEALDYHLAHSYIVNFSLFQSMPDAWAIGQIIPVMPIHRLDERPSEHGVLLDLTCDSDGRIDRYPTGSGTRSCLPMHAWTRGESYVLGAFLVGAYQEVMGNRHNLFAGVPSMSVNVHGDGRVVVKDPENALSSGDMCASVGYDAEVLAERVRVKLASAGLEGFAADHALAEFENALAGSTYLGVEAGDGR
jgi:arginine decarboxylase